MDFGLTGKLGEYYLTQQYQKNRAAGKSDSVSFAELAAAKAAGTERVEGMSFKDMWQARFPDKASACHPSERTPPSLSCGSIHRPCSP